MDEQIQGSDNLSKSSQSSNWHPKDGWNGLVPGSSKVDDAIAKFGQPEGEVEFANGKWFEFVNKSVQVVILNRDPETIAKIRLLAEFPDKNLVPENINGIERIYGAVKKIDLDELSTITYARPGLRVACYFFQKPHPVEWLEFFPVDG